MSFLASSLNLHTAAKDRFVSLLFLVPRDVWAPGLMLILGKSCAKVHPGRSWFSPGPFPRLASSVYRAHLSAWLVSVQLTAFFFFGCMWDLNPGIEPAYPALEACSLNYWTTGEVATTLSISLSLNLAQPWVLPNIMQGVQSFSHVRLTSDS